MMNVYIGQINTIALCVSMHIEVDKRPNKNGLQAGFGPRGSIWGDLTLTNNPYTEPRGIGVSHWCVILAKWLLQNSHGSRSSVMHQSLHRAKGEWCMTLECDPY